MPNRPIGAGRIARESRKRTQLESIGRAKGPWTGLRNTSPFIGTAEGPSVVRGGIVPWNDYRMPPTTMQHSPTVLIFSNS